MPTSWYPAHRRSFCWFVALVLAFIAVPVAAQIPGLPQGIRPTPDQARQLLQSRPDLVQELRQRIQSSGLTPDQIRARLAAAGYPEDLLDPYLSGGDTTRVGTPLPGTLDAVQSLGLIEPGTLDTLRQIESMGPTDPLTRRIVDSLRRVRADSLRADSLGDSTKARKKDVKLFGIEVFRRTTTSFQPVQAGPVDENYRLGPGDVLVLILTGDVEQAQTLDVNREGFILIPQVGQVFVANLTLAQLEDQLYGRLGRVYSGIRRGPNPRTRFTVTVTRLRNIQVLVTGDVVRPGAYQISAAGTVLSALYAAGGPTESGSFRHVELRRGGKLVDSVDIYDYLLRGINRSDIHLESGDVVFVPVRGGLVKATGRVVRPAIYEMKPNETLRDLINAAGGFEANALQGRVQIHRILPAAARGPAGADRAVIDISDEQFASGTVPAFPLVPGDSVTVFPLAKRPRNFVTVQGNVWVEGRVGYTPAMRLSEAIRLAGGPKPDVYLNQVLISRVHSDSSRVQLRSAFADSTGKVTDDIPLEQEDEIRVFSRAAFRPQPWITIVGAVRHSGRIPYREGMTLRDAVLFADGLTEDASLDAAEIARLPADRPTGALAQTIRAPLDSSYLFARNVPAGTPAATGPTLEPYDNVLIQRQPGYDLQRLVAVTGQVQHPGRYAMTSKTERLSDLLERAGGLTTEAYAGGIEFYRRREAPARARVPTSDDASHPVRPLPPGFAERLGVDLPTVLKDPKSPDNIILSAGDSIRIPEYDPIVTVQGAVNSPGPITYTPGKNLDWYVSSAGGYSANGDRKRVYVTQPDGKKQTVARRFLLGDTQPKPGPGAVILVPKREPEQSGNVASVLGVLASVAASLTTLIVVLRR